MGTGLEGPYPLAYFGRIGDRIENSSSHLSDSNTDFMIVSLKPSLICTCRFDSLTVIRPLLPSAYGKSVKMGLEGLCPHADPDLCRIGDRIANARSDLEESNIKFIL